MNGHQDAELNDPRELETQRLVEIAVEFLNRWDAYPSIPGSKRWQRNGITAILELAARAASTTTAEPSPSPEIVCLDCGGKPGTGHRPGCVPSRPVSTDEEEGERCLARKSWSGYEGGSARCVLPDQHEGDHQFPGFGPVSASSVEARRPENQELGDGHSPSSGGRQL